jgi:hypothetical protein
MRIGDPVHPSRQHSNAMFAIIRYEAARKPLGNSFTCDTTIAELRSLSGSSSTACLHAPERGW